jgi:hypothetical protein
MPSPFYDNETGFSPTSLFLAGEVGGWYDPSDVANTNWRVNLLSWTEVLTNPVWTNINTIVSSPDAQGWMRLEAATTANTNFYQPVVGAGSASGNTFTLQVKKGSGANDANRFFFRNDTTATTLISIQFNYDTGVVSGTPGVSDVTVTAGANAGEWTLKFTPSSGISAGDTLRFYPIFAGATDTAGEFAFVRNMQLEVGTVSTTYQPATNLYNDLNTRFPTAALYQDQYGTAHVTAPGQTVGLMLDKSKGLALGPELRGTGVVGLAGTATAATYNTTTGVGSVSRVDASNQSFVTFGGLTSGQYYRMVITNTGSVSLLVRSNNNTGTILQTVASGAGNSSVTLFATANSALVITPLTNATTATFVVTTLTTSAGNHALQGTTANCPIYSIEPVGGRRNLGLMTSFTSLTGTAGSQIPNATGWSNVGSSGGTRTYVPSSQFPGDQAIDISGVVDLRNVIGYTITPLPSTTYTVSLWVESFSGVVGSVSTTTGAASTGSTGAPSSTGRMSYNFTSDSISTPVVIRFGIGMTGNSTGSVRISGIQVEVGSTATAYQRVTSQYDVTQAGVPSMSYLFFDGASDNLATPTITPGTNKVQMFSGVRKLANTVGTIAELGAASGDGLAALYGNSSNNYGVLSKGTLQATVVSPSGATVPPITNAVTGLGDISTDTTTIRINGSQVATSSTDQGTGNYLAYPLYIGARAGASLFFSGHLYSLIARFGPNLTADQLSSTETWVASKTGITI